MKKVAILQSNYVPWKGYFDLIASVDEFVLYDDMQYTRRDWRNRTQIKTPNGVQWLTVPVLIKGKYYQTIKDTQINGEAWAAAHWKSLSLNYGRAPHYKAIAVWLEPIYRTAKHSYLSHVNRELLEAVCAFLDIRTPLVSSSNYRLVEGRSERLAEICLQAGATEYVSGPAAKDYLDESVFRDRGINVIWFDYGGYQEYPQLWGDFTHGVSILDLLFNCGAQSRQYMKCALK